MKGRKEDLPIYVPEGCSEALLIVNSFTQQYKETMLFTPQIKELKDYEEVIIAGIKVKGFPVVHFGGVKGFGILDQIPAFGYRISHKREIIAISGDTGICSTLKELVKGADIAFIEATIPSSKKAPTEIIEKVHLSEDLAHEVGKLAKYYILIHKTKPE
jgi:ribonuclease BN (tRNA processing enzyme)